MKSGVATLLVIYGITFAAAGCAFALTDAELIAVRDGFDSRRDAMLASQVAKPYPFAKSGNLNVWGLQDYALAALYLNEDLPKANKAVIDAVDLMLSDKALLDKSGHWKGNLFFRIYRFFAHDSKYYPGRLTGKAESKICEFFWKWAKSRSKIANADIEAYQTWSYWGSENHDAQRHSTAWSAASILKDVSPYNTYSYDDGSSAKQQYEAYTAYVKEYLRQRAMKGLCIEIGTPTYTKYTLQGWYNYFDFAEDKELKKVAGMTLDLWWADWAESQINSVWGGGKSRVYKDASIKGAGSTTAMSWYYLNIGSPKSKHPGVMCVATTTHRLPLVVMDIALDVSGRGVYEKTSRRPGLRKLPTPDKVPAEINNVCDPDFGGNLRYTYVTPEFIFGTCMVQKRPDKDWTAISSQNRWHGAIFANHRDCRVFPAVEGIPVSYGKTYNPHWSVQNKGTLITQKIRQKHNGDMRVYFSSKHLKISESGGCVFADSGGAYAAVRPVRGSYKWDDKNWIRYSDPFAPVIMEVAQASDYDNELKNFMRAVLRNKPSVSNDILTYTGLGDSGVFTFDTKGKQTPTINGVPVDYAPDYTFKSPFINEDWASGIVAIKKDKREITLDFTKKKILPGQTAFEQADKVKWKTVSSEHFVLRGGLKNSQTRFVNGRKGTVAFLGGSITEMSGWRELTYKLLEKRFPQTKFKFIDAGISSVDSTGDAFRLERDVLTKGPVDLLFVEASVNDFHNQRNKTERIRAMEGIIRHTWSVNPKTDIVFMCFVDKPYVDMYTAGKTPEVIADHLKVAAHYNIPSINMAKEVTDRINAGQFKWEKFRNCHPSAFGHQLYADSIDRLFDAAWTKPVRKNNAGKPHKLARPLDKLNYQRGCLVDIKNAEIVKGFKLVKSWKPAGNGRTRDGFVNVPMLVAEKNAAELKFRFKGTAAGMFIIAGPDAGIIEASIDGGNVKTIDLFTRWSRRLHLPWMLMTHTDFDNSEHVLTIKTTADKNPASKGNAIRIVYFAAN